MKAWLKGGLIGIGGWIILFIFPELRQILFGWIAYFFVPTGDIFQISRHLLLKIFPYDPSYELRTWIIVISTVYLINPLLFFLIGALIGSLISKIRSKNETSN